MSTRVISPATSTAKTSCRLLPMPLLDVDLADLDNFANGFPHEVFDRHRLERPAT